MQQHVPLPKGFYRIDAAPDANLDVFSYAGSIIAVQDHIDTRTLISKGADGETFVWKVTDTRADLYEIKVYSSNFSCLGTSSLLSCKSEYQILMF